MHHLAKPPTPQAYLYRSRYVLAPLCLMHDAEGSLPETYRSPASLAAIGGSLTTPASTVSENAVLESAVNPRTVTFSRPRKSGSARLSNRRTPATLPCRTTVWLARKSSTQGQPLYDLWPRDTKSFERSGMPSPGVPLGHGLRRVRSEGPPPGDREQPRSVDWPLDVRFVAGWVILGYDFSVKFFFRILRLPRAECPTDSAPLVCAD